MRGPGARSFEVGPWLALGARWVVGGMFLWMGLSKAMHPVEFLKQVRAYELMTSPLWLNLVAAGLPWFEVMCGLLLVLGVAVRGTALAVVGMLVPFSVAVVGRGLEMAEAGGVPFCGIKFDCGCGTGEVFVCRKLVENGLLTVVAAALVFWREHRWGWRPVVVGVQPSCQGSR